MVVFVIFIPLPKLWAHQAEFLVKRLYPPPQPFFCSSLFLRSKILSPYFFRPYCHVLAELSWKLPSGIVSGRTPLDSMKSSKPVFFLPHTPLVLSWRIINILTYVLLSLLLFQNRSFFFFSACITSCLLKTKYCQVFRITEIAIYV